MSLRLLSSLVVLSGSLQATPLQDSTSSEHSTDNATSIVAVDSVQMNTDAVYARPFLQRSTEVIGFGGYVEANVQGGMDAGIPTGISFQARRFTLFVSSAPSHHLRFLAELEFENGTEEIGLEFASLDLLLSRSLILRGGIMMIPIGGFNQNHDGPRWNFVDRPFSATQLLPATWSAVGMGVLGKIPVGSSTLSYEVYASNGLNEDIVSNDLRRTSLPAAKEDPLRFAESSNGHVMLSGRTALSSTLGEFGVSYAGGVYSRTHDDGLDVGPALWNHSAAIDYSIGSFASTWYVRAEGAYVHVDLPVDHEPSYASGQFGGYADVTYALWRGKSFVFDESAVYVSVRGEYVDFHLPTPGDGGASGDEIASATLAVAYHPASGTIVRVNYRNTWTTDVLGNDAVHSNVIQLGVTSYF